MKEEIVAAMKRTAWYSFWIIVFGFVIGGAVGNIIDRVRLAYVIDFIDMGLGNLRWFTYNLADAFITVGAVFLLVRELFFKQKSRNA